MKNILIAAVVFLATITTATAQNFIFDKNGGIMWQKVYITDMTSAELHKSLYFVGCLTDIRKVDDTFYIAALKRSTVNYEYLGYKRMQLPLYLVNSDVKGAAMIQYKEGKYKVTVKDVDLIPLANFDYGTLNDMAIAEDGYFTETFTTVAGEIYHQVFSKWFELEKITDEW